MTTVLLAFLIMLLLTVAMAVGVLQEGVARHIIKDQDERIRQLTSTDISRSLEISVEELLRKVPFFADINLICKH